MAEVLTQPPPQTALTRGLRLILATASGAAVANLYYNQPMLADIGETFRAGAHEVGLIATTTQVGYAIGMPLFIPPSDFINRRAVVVLLFSAVACALVAAAISPSLAWLMAASFLIGVTTVIAQILIPLATEIAPPPSKATQSAPSSQEYFSASCWRGPRAVLSRHFGWRAMFWVAAAAAALFAIVGSIEAAGPACVFGDHVHRSDEFHVDARCRRAEAAACVAGCSYVLRSARFGRG